MITINNKIDFPNMREIVIISVEVILELIREIFNRNHITFNISLHQQFRHDSPLPSRDRLLNCLLPRESYRAPEVN